MSWQGYVDQSLLGTGKVDKAAIFNSEGNSVWACSKDFSVKPEEIKAIITGYSNAAPLYERGVHIGSTKYMCIKADERSIYGRKEKEGICVVKTKQALLVAHYPEGVQSGEAAKIVEALADYLIGVGY